jgi:hypothetical protein
MAERDRSLDYTGIHAFVFVDRVDPGVNIREVVDTLRAFGPPPKGPVIFASDFVGDYLAFAHLRVEEEDLAGLQDLISGALWERGVHCKYAVEAATYKDSRTDIHIGTKRGTPEIIGLVSIRVERGRVDDVLEQLGALPGFKGASVLFGDVDILLQLGGDTFKEVADAAMQGLQGVDGIVHTSTAFADGRRFETS